MAYKQQPTKKVRNDLPHNTDAEKAVLGSAFLSKDALYTVLSLFSKRAFSASSTARRTPKQNPKTEARTISIRAEYTFPHKMSRREKKATYSPH